MQRDGSLMAHNGVVSATEPSRAFDCPRCGSPCEGDFYGPCEQCRGVLRATITAEAKEVESGGYEPKMNVTPNAVATKD